MGLLQTKGGTSVGIWFIGEGMADCIGDSAVDWVWFVGNNEVLNGVGFCGASVVEVTRGSHGLE